jgi:hypothetical protein
MDKYQLVMQFEASSLKDYERLVAFERKLKTELGSLADVDGHDFGQEEFNVFILTDHPKTVFEKAQGFLETQDIPNYMRAAYREATGEDEDYVVLWPPNLTEFCVS